MINIYILVSNQLYESKWFECCVKLNVPIFTSLFQAIDGEYKFANLVCTIVEPKRLFHINFLIKFAIEISSNNIHAMNL